MILSIAWKNIWRNKTRSSVLIASIALGMAGGLFICALSLGMIQQRIDAAIRNETAHVQMHHPHFLVEKEMEDTLFSPLEKLAFIYSLKEVKAATARIKLTGMIATATKGAGVTIMGIDPVREKEVSGIHACISEGAGSYLDATTTPNAIVIGKKLAEELKVKLRSKVILTFQASNGDLVQAAFKITGLYKTSNTPYDEVHVFVRHSDISRLAGYNSRKAHEIAIVLKDDRYTLHVKDTLAGRYPEATTQSWKEVLPEVGMISEATTISLYVIMIIFLLGLCFGIINTMLMAIMERTRELGMLMAVGMSRRRVFYMIMAETVLLSLTGALIGIGAGLGITTWYFHRGFDLSRFASGLEQVGYDAVVYPFLTPDFIAGIILLVVFTGLFSAVIPARRALRLKPAEAIRKG